MFIDVFVSVKKKKECTHHVYIEEDRVQRRGPPQGGSFDVFSISLCAVSVTEHCERDERAENSCGPRSGF